jgi:hypothetical protein
MLGRTPGNFDVVVFDAVTRDREAAGSQGV